MKAILEFDLDDMGDCAYHEMAIKGRDSYIAIYRIKELADVNLKKEHIDEILYSLGINLNVLP